MPATRSLFPAASGRGFHAAGLPDAASPVDDVAPSLPPAAWEPPLLAAESGLSLAAEQRQVAMAVLVLYSRVDELARGEELDMLSELETAQVAEEIVAGLRSLGYRVALAGASADVAAALAPYPPDAWLVFNLCESPGGDTAREAAVPLLLEGRGYAYTGAGAEAITCCLDKARTKALLVRHGIATPRYAVLARPNAPCDVPLPALVKPLAEDASKGISTDSVVRDREALARQVAYILERYRQPALVEEFVAGREFNVAVWGDGRPEALPLSEIHYDGFADPLQRLLTYEAKWVEDSFACRHTTGICPAEVDGLLARRLRETALAAYRLTHSRGYARVDMRERDGVPYVLEVNPNPSLASDAGFARAARVAGYDHAHMAERIVSLALAQGRPPFG